MTEGLDLQIRYSGVLDGGGGVLAKYLFCLFAQSLAPLLLGPQQTTSIEHTTLSP